jgi:ligand-binding sensor domain-containing protein/serine phosphatase RsbU (regulator of sigma subunit)
MASNSLSKAQYSMQSNTHTASYTRIYAANRAFILKRLFAVCVRAVCIGIRAVYGNATFSAVLGTVSAVIIVSLLVPSRVAAASLCAPVEARSETKTLPPTELPFDDQPTITGNINFERIGREQGLSESAVTAILQDKRGFLWVGTQNGLNRYDGYTFTVFRQNPNDTASLANNNIKALLEDRSGALWVGTSNGLHRYDRFTGRFVRYQANPENKNSLAHNDVSSIAEDHTGTLWVGTKRGLSRFDPRTGTFKLYKAHKKRKPGFLSDNDIATVFADVRKTSAGEPSTTIWIGTRTGGLNMLNPQTDEVTVFQSSEDEMNDGTHSARFALSANSSSMHLPSSLSDDAVSGIAKAPDGTLWIATRSGGVNSLKFSGEPRSPATAKFRAYTAASGLSDNFVRSVFVDHAGQVWIGTRNGVQMFNTCTEEFALFKNSPNNMHSLSDNDVSTVFEDRAGLLWVGTSGGGLNKFVPRSAYFSNVRFSAAKDNGEKSNSIVSAIHLNNDRTLWVGTSGGAAMFPKGFPVASTPKSLEPLVSLSKDEGNTLSDDLVTAILPDRFNADLVWIGTESGLNLYSRSKRKTRVLRHDDADATSLSDDYINCLLQDRTGAIWVGTGGGGLSRLDPRTLDAQTPMFTTFRNDPMDSSSLADNFVFALIEDNNGTIWAGTGGGLSRFEAASGRFTHFRHDDRNPKSLSENSILSLCQDHLGNLWVGTYGGGLNQLAASATKASDPRQAAFTRYAEANGLPNDVVYGIIEDGKGRLWVSTGRGLARFTFQAGQTGAKSLLRVYDASDGLLANEFRKGAAHRGVDGTLYFGVGYGLVMFHPDSLRDSRHLPLVAITAFRKYNETVLLDSSITEKTVLMLDHTDNTFSFEFAALDFANPSKNQYAYRMMGFDDRWIPLGNERVARYTNLDPGEYVFQVKASNSDGVWNEAGTMLRVVVRPPWWATLWFRAIAVLTVAGAVVVGYKQRVRKIQEVNKHLESVIASRTEEITEKNVELENLLDQAEHARSETQQAYNLLEIEHARKSAELEEARVLQLSMLPKHTPSVHGLDVAFSMRTATEVGGDYYDYAMASDGTLTLAIGDATGHGVRAGMMVSMVKSNFHALSEVENLGDIACQISRTIKRMNMRQMFMCLTLARYRNHGEHGSVELSGAGMPPALVFRAATMTMEKVRLHGIVPGAVEHFDYDTKKLYLKRGDVVLMYSDGLVELFNHCSEELGEERVIACLQSICSQARNDAAAIIHSLNAMTDEWLDGKLPNDDIALVLLKQM